MKKIFNIVLILSLCFFVKTQAQVKPWTIAEKQLAVLEVEWVNEVILLSNTQKDLLEEVFLKKSRNLADGVRVEWKKIIILETVEDIIRYGQYINRHPGSENIHLATEYVSQADFDQKISANSELLTKLNLKVSDNY